MPKQTTIDLPGMSGDPRPERLLYKVGAKEMKDLCCQLDRCTKAGLESQAEIVFKLMRKYRFLFASEDGTTQTPPIIATFEKSKYQKKPQFEELMALFTHERNAPVLLENMPEQGKKLLPHVLRNHYLIRQDVERIVGEKCFVESEWNHCAYVLTNLYKPYFSSGMSLNDVLEYGTYRARAPYVEVAPMWLRMLLKREFADVLSAQSVKSLPEDENLKLYGNERLMHAYIPQLASLYDNRVLPHGVVKLTAIDVKKGQKALSPTDFFECYPGPKQATLSAALMFHYYMAFRDRLWRKKVPSTMEDVVKAIYEETMNCDAHTISVLLPYIKGFRRPKLSGYPFAHLLRLLADVLGNCTQGWTPVDTLIMRVRTHNEGSENIFMILDQYELEEMTLRNGYMADQIIHLGNVVRHVAEPFIKAYLFMLSTFGIVEVAYREPEPGSASCYDGLRYVRLTPLGQYAMGITTTYTPEACADEKPAFEIDDQRLMVKVLDPDTPLRPLLSDMAEKITPSLYLVTYDSFLRGCCGVDDVQNKVKLFRQFVSDQQVDIWTHFFEQVTSRCHPMETIQTGYHMFSVPSDNLDLQRLILTEPSVRQYVVKVENYMILVKNTDLRPFANALRKFGYLL